ADHQALASPDLLEITERLGVERAPGSDENTGSLPIDQGDRSVLHLGRGVALGMDVADFLEFQRTLQRDGIVDITTEVQCAARRGDSPGRLLDERLRLEDLPE